MGDSGLHEVELDRTVMYATGGDKPSDTGTIAGRQVVSVRHDPGITNGWSTPRRGEHPPEVGETVEVVVDSQRRHPQLMRTTRRCTFSAGSCGAITVSWSPRQHGTAVGSVDFEFPEPPDGFAQDLRAGPQCRGTRRPADLGLVPAAAVRRCSTRA